MAFPSLRLTYFNIAGRAEAVRLALHHAGIPFEDIRLSNDEWQALKPSLPLGQLPVLEVNGKIIPQSDTILRYAGRLSETYPTDPLEAARVDEVLIALNDLADQIVGTGKISVEEEKKKAREGLLVKNFPRVFGNLEKKASATSSGFLFGSEPTVADFKLFAVVNGIRKGVYDYIPATSIDGYPAIIRLIALVRALPTLSAYFVKSAKSYPSLKVTYFDFPGRAEPLRLALKVGGIPFVDERLSKEQFVAAQASGRFPYGQVPVLEVNGTVLAQSTGILRYIGTLAGLYPTNVEDAVEVDEILDTIDDLGGKFTASAYLPEEIKKVERVKTAETELPRTFAVLQKRIEANPSGYLTSRLSIADFHLFGLLGAIKSGNLDFVSPAILDAYPTLLKFLATFSAIPQVKEHFANSAPKTA